MSTWDISHRQTGWATREIHDKVSFCAINFLWERKSVTALIYIFITQARKNDQSDYSVGLNYLSIFHPNNPTLVLGMPVGCNATDTSSSN